MLKINAVYINICVCCYYSQPVAAILFTHGTSGSASALIFSHRYNKIFAIPLAFITRLSQAQSKYLDNRFTFKNIYQRRSIFLVRCIRKRRQQIVEYSSNTLYNVLKKIYIFKNVVNCYKKIVCLDLNNKFFHSSTLSSSSLEASNPSKLESKSLASQNTCIAAANNNYCSSLASVVSDSA